MRALKVCLWIIGVLYLLSVVGLFLPMSTLESLAHAVAEGEIPQSPAFAYAVRVLSGTFVLIGIFYIILAREPERYPVLVPFSGVGSIAIGLISGVAGGLGQLPMAWFLGDCLSLSCFGVLILIFWGISQNKSPEEPEPVVEESVDEPDLSC
ncbi:MAG: hypothetical protein KGZ25_07880 [Planctomycetes bacterium]|nr:hypothetical protein [Planctomycetota bacterium]